MLASQHSIAISDMSQIGEARRCASRFADEVGLDETTRGKAAIIATELATNLAHHANSGEVFLRTMHGAATGLEILSVDHGPGMSNIARCLEDGYSTRGTAGNGLGAVRRMSSLFEMASSPPGGTVIVSHLLLASSQPVAPRSSWGVIGRPAPLETYCGDTWRIVEGAEELVLLTVDGLGHGPEAAKAADLAAKSFEQDPFAPLVETIQRIDRMMRGSRGGAVALARFDWQAGIVRYVGVGNISARLKSVGDEPARGLLSHNGIVGVQARKIQEFQYPLPQDGILVMHTDGLQGRWSLEGYNGWTSYHPTTIAGMLYRDHTRGRDDVTVAVVRFHAERR